MTKTGVKIFKKTLGYRLILAINQKDLIPLKGLAATNVVVWVGKTLCGKLKSRHSSFSPRSGIDSHSNSSGQSNPNVFMYG